MEWSSHVRQSQKYFAVFCVLQIVESLFQTLDPYIETTTTTTDIYNINIQYQAQ